MSFANYIELCYKSGSGPLWLRRHNLEEKWLGVSRFAIMRTVNLFSASSYFEGTAEIVLDINYLNNEK